MEVAEEEEEWGQTSGQASDAQDKYSLHMVHPSAESLVWVCCHMLPKKPNVHENLRILWWAAYC